MISTTPERNYRSEVVGSLLRPDYLKDAMGRFEAGALSARELEQVRDRAVLEAIALQEACDIDVIMRCAASGCSSSTILPGRALSSRCGLCLGTS